MIRVKRVYEKPAKEDSFRLLVDRLWPRGLTKERAAVDLWMKEIAPSDALRKWFGHEPEKWPEFEKRYLRSTVTESAIMLNRKVEEFPLASPMSETVYDALTLELFNERKTIIKRLTDEALGRVAEPPIAVSSSTVDP